VEAMAVTTPCASSDPPSTPSTAPPAQPINSDPTSTNLLSIPLTVDSQLDDYKKYRKQAFQAGEVGLINTWISYMTLYHLYEARQHYLTMLNAKRRSNGKEDMSMADFISDELHLRSGSTKARFGHIRAHWDTFYKYLLRDLRILASAEISWGQVPTKIQDRMEERLISDYLKLLDEEESVRLKEKWMVPISIDEEDPVAYLPKTSQLCHHDFPALRDIWKQRMISQKKKRQHDSEQDKVNKLEMDVKEMALMVKELEKQMRRKKMDIKELQTGRDKADDDSVETAFQQAYRRVTDLAEDVGPQSLQEMIKSAKETVYHEVAASRVAEECKEVEERVKAVLEDAHKYMTLGLYLMPGDMDIVLLTTSLSSKLLDVTNAYQATMEALQEATTGSLSKVSK
jgi:hypothetical protein